MKSLPLDANYWRRHARETVRFAESIRCLQARGIRAFLEIGPAPVLIGMGRQCLEDSEAVWLASLRKDRDDWPQMLSSLGALFVLGAKPDWRALRSALSPTSCRAANLSVPKGTALASGCLC